MLLCTAQFSQTGSRVTAVTVDATDERSLPLQQHDSGQKIERRQASCADIDGSGAMFALWNQAFKAALKSTSKISHLLPVGRGKFVRGRSGQLEAGRSAATTQKKCKL